MAGCSGQGPEYTDYFSEVKDIEEGSEAVEQTDEELPKTPDEGEQEVSWLNDAGYGHLVSKIEVGEELDAELLEKETQSLTAAQAAAVRKRVDTLNTLKKRNKQRKADVREIFGSNAEPSSDGSSSVVSSASTSTQELPTERRQTSRKAHRTSFLGHRGGYSMTGSSSAVVDGISSPGISMLGIHSTDVRPSLDTAANQSKMDDTDAGKSVDYDHRSVPLVGSQTICADRRLLDGMYLDGDQGITRINDLGTGDLGRVRPLALIQLTAVYDQQGIVFTRRKTKRRGRDSGLFGVQLQTLLENDRKKHASLRVPLIFCELIKYLEATSLSEEGILRVPGAVARIKSLRQELELRYKRGRLSLTDVRAHDAAGLLKQFLRELPTPLLTYEYLEAFVLIDKISGLQQQVEALNYLIMLLPDVHRDTLQLLLRFLKVVSDAEENKMTVSNVAMIMAPNLFLVGSSWNDGGGARRTPKSIKDLVEVSMAAGISNVVQLLIQYQEQLWKVPSVMMSQVRHQYQLENHQAESKRSRDTKPLLKFLGKKDKSEIRQKRDSPNELSASSNMIRVNAPQLSKFNTTIQLDQLLTAADVLARFSSVPELAPSRDGNGCESSGDELENNGAAVTSLTSSPISIHLYEVGGNIGERRLDLCTNIMSLYQVNPNAELVIKMHPLY